MRRITETLRTYLPIRYEEAIDVLFAMDNTCIGFPYLFFPDFVAVYGLEEEHWELSMKALLTERFYNAENKVIICGRRKEKLLEAKEKMPNLHILVCDVANEADRLKLFDSIVNEFPELDVLVNNAGIQQRINLQTLNADWSYYHQEIIANLEAPIHLTMLFLPHLLKKKEGAVINVSSNLGVTPAAWVPIYSATKAAMHSFTMSLRLQLAETTVNIVEVMPSAINTDLGGVGLHTFGVPVNEFADAVIL